MTRYDPDLALAFKSRSIFLFGKNESKNTSILRHVSEFWIPPIGPKHSFPLLHTCH